MCLCWPMNRLRYLTLIICGVILCFALLIVRYYKIQICDGAYWSEEALNQHVFHVKDPFRRGTFFSNTQVRRGDIEQFQPFVIDVTKFHLCVDAMAIPEVHRDSVATILLNLTGEGEKKDLLKQLEKRSRNRKLFMWLDGAERDRILAWWKPYASEHKIPPNALFFVSDYQRSYPFGKLLGQVLHTLREVKNEKTGKAFPTGGLEAFFDHILEGEHGERKLLRSPLNRMDLDQVIKIPKDGADVYLTVNPCIQTIAEEELEIGVKEAKAKGGRLVLMHASTGEILALAQYPFFDPSNYKLFFNDSSQTEYTKVAAVSDVFEPGSIMKPLTIALALLANEELTEPLFQPDEPIDVSRTQFPGRKRYPLRDISRNRSLNMYMAIQKSSNVYVAQLVDRIVQTLGHTWYEEKLRLLGFGKKTGIELPGEASGMVPSVNKRKQWSAATPYSLAMGYNLLATNIQMVCAYAMLANGGFEVSPTLVKKIVSSTGEEYVLPAKGIRRRILPESVVRETIHAMRFTTCKGGTGVRAAPGRHTSAGKTGTTEKLVDGYYDKKRHISSFIGITPLCTPLVMIVTVDDPEHSVRQDGTKNYMGGRCAAPIFSRVADRVLDYLGVPSDLQESSFQLELSSLRDLYEQWNQR